MFRRRKSGPPKEMFEAAIALVTAWGHHDSDAAAAVVRSVDPEGLAIATASVAWALIEAINNTMPSGATAARTWQLMCASMARQWTRDDPA